MVSEDPERPPGLGVNWVCKWSEGAHGLKDGGSPCVCPFVGDVLVRARETRGQEQYISKQFKHCILYNTN